MTTLTDLVMVDVTHRQHIGTLASPTLVIYVSDAISRANETVVLNLVSDLFLAILPV